MSKLFDPYHKWLGISPKDQPPNHYRLLGVDLFESDLDVITHAADMRMTLVRNFQSGKRSDHAKRLRNEIAAARVCLLDSKKKVQYDDQLRQTQTAETDADTQTLKLQAQLVVLQERLKLLEKVEDEFSPSLHQATGSEMESQLTDSFLGELKAAKGKFNFDSFVAKTGADPQLANLAAQDAYARIFSLSLTGDVSASSKVNSSHNYIAKLLKISAEEQSQIELRSIIQKTSAEHSPPVRPPAMDKLPARKQEPPKAALGSCGSVIPAEPFDLTLDELEPVKTKPCPFCGKTISAGAKQCKHCLW